jgi:hypothetical protein
MHVIRQSLIYVKDSPPKLWRGPVHLHVMSLRIALLTSGCVLVCTFWSVPSIFGLGGSGPCVTTTLVTRVYTHTHSHVQYIYMCTSYIHIHTHNTNQTYTHPGIGRKYMHMRYEERLIHAIQSQSILSTKRSNIMAPKPCSKYMLCGHTCMLGSALMQREHDGVLTEGQHRHLESLSTATTHKRASLARNTRILCMFEACRRRGVAHTTRQRIWSRSHISHRHVVSENKRTAEA